MGKQPQHKNKQARVQRTKGSGVYVVKGKRVTLQYCTADAIASDLRSKGYPVGTSVSWNGKKFSLSRDEWTLDATLVQTGATL